MENKKSSGNAKGVCKYAILHVHAKYTREPLEIFLHANKNRSTLHVHVYVHKKFTFRNVALSLITSEGSFLMPCCMYIV